MLKFLCFSIVSLLAIACLSIAFGPYVSAFSLRNGLIRAAVTRQLCRRDASILQAVKSTACIAKDELTNAVVPLLSTFVALTVASQRVNAVDKNGNYRTDPTTEFKEEEARNAALKLKEKKTREDWDAIYNRLKASTDAETSAKALTDLFVFITPLDGIPTGVKKTDLVRMCRKLKYKDPARLRGILPTWTTPVEIAYEKLIKAFNKKVSPASLDVQQF